MDNSITVFSPLIDIPIMLTYTMVGIGALAILYFAIKNMIQLSGESKKTFYSIGGLAIAIITAFALSSDNVLPSYEKYNITSDVSKRVGMGLNMFYLLSIGAIGAILYTELSKMFSK